MSVPKSVSDAFKRFDADGTLGYHVYLHYSFVVPSHPLREDTAEMLFQSIEEVIQGLNCHVLIVHVGHP